MQKIIFFIFTLLLTTYSFSYEQEALHLSTTQAHSSITIVSEHNYLYAGHKYYIGLDIQPDPNWHTHWINPGDSAPASTFKFKPIAGVSFSAPLYPTPTRFMMGQLYSFGYENSVLVQFEIEISIRYNQRSLPIELEAEWMVCNEECIPGFHTFKLILPVLPYPFEFTDEEFLKIQETTLNKPYLNQFKSSRESWPQALSGTIVSKDSETEVSFKKLSHLIDIFPYPDSGVTNAPPLKIEESNQNSTIKYQFKNIVGTIPAGAPSFLISYKDESGNLKSYKLSTSQDQSVSKILLIVLFGFLGGLIIYVLFRVLSVPRANLS